MKPFKYELSELDERELLIYSTDVEAFVKDEITKKYPTHS
jgi:hypothetical protein